MEFSFRKRWQRRYPTETGGGVGKGEGGGGGGKGFEAIRWRNPYDESSFEASLGIWDLTVDSCYI